MIAPADTLAALEEARVIAVVRGRDAAAAVRTAEALLEGGVQAVELTYTTPDAAQALAELRRRHAAALLGMGTVTRPFEAAESASAGASFLVCPGSPPQLVRSMVMTGRAVLAGCLTPTEIVAALEAGAHAIKLFPADAVGPAYLTALRGPFPATRFIPTGGIEPADILTWIDAGAAAVGIGGALARPVHDDDDRRAVVAAAREAVGISRRPIA